MDNYVGKRLDGRYEIQEMVGVGGMAIVYKAYDNVDDRIVAVKVLKDEYLNNEDFKRRFKNESKAIALLSHPNIVKVFDVNFGQNIQYIVEEYIDGITLKEYINKQGAIEWNDSLYFMSQILKAVQHAHDKGIVHRDIKPQNIILLTNGSIKVTDFGIARFSRSHTMTMTDSAIGSVHYIAPEQAKGDMTDERADIYSLGVVLYEMLSGKVPFDADTAVSVALMQCQASAERLTQINPDIPIGLEQICMHAMEKLPKNRYQTATEMLLDIQQIIKNSDTTFNYASIDNENPTMVISKDNIKSLENEELEQDDFDNSGYEDKKAKNKTIAAVVTGVVVLAVAIVLLVMRVTGSLNTSTTKLENFVGMSYDDLIEKNIYKYEFIAEYEKDDKHEAGTIISQMPEAGTKIITGSKVTLKVASSEKDVTVPNVFNLTEEKAIKALELEGLTKYKITKIADVNREEGKVVYTIPKPNIVVKPDTEIEIFVSSGPPVSVVSTSIVPDVTNMTSQSGIRSFLKNYGFDNVSFEITDSNLPEGVAFAQEPKAGQTVESGTKIVVKISSGLPPVKEITLNITLPEEKDALGLKYQKDILFVSLNGTKCFSKEYELNGQTVPLTLTVDNSKPDIEGHKLLLECNGNQIELFISKEDASNGNYVVNETFVDEIHE